MFAQSQSIFCLSHYPPTIRVGVQKDLGGDVNWESWAKGIFQNIWHQVKHIKKSWGEKWRDIWSDDICPPKSPLHLMEPCCPGNTEHLPARGKQWIKSLLFFFVCCEQIFVFPIKLSLSQHEFYYFHSFNSLLILRGCPELSCQLELNHMCLWHDVTKHDFVLMAGILV